MEKKIKELDLLNQITHLLNSSLSKDVVFNSLLARSIEILGAVAGTIALLEDGEDNFRDLVFQYTCGKAAEKIKGIRIQTNQGLIGWVVSNNKPVIVNDVEKDPRFFPGVDQLSSFKTRSILCAPIKSGEKVIGAIEILNKKRGLFDKSDLGLLNTIVDVAALSIRNSLLHRDILSQRDYYSGIMESLNEGVIVLYRDLTILDVNQSLLNFFNKERSDIIGRKCHFILFHRDNPCPDCFLSKKGIFEKGQDFSFNCSLKDIEGGFHYFMVSGAPLEVQDEIISSVLMTFNDVTGIERFNSYIKATASVASLLLKSGSIQGRVEDVLKILGQTAGASRSYWSENYNDKSGKILSSRRAEWCADGIEPQINNPRLQDLGYENDFQGWYQELCAGNIISGLTAGFTDAERAFLEQQDIKSILVIPLFIKGDFKGFIGFDNCVNETTWHDVEVNLLCSAADSLAKAFEHEKSDKEIKESEARYRDIFENIYEIWYLHDMEGRVLEVNPAFGRIAGYHEKELLSMTLQDLIPGRYKNQFDNYMEELQRKGKAEGLVRLITKSGEEKIFEYCNWLVELPGRKTVSRGLVRDVTDRIKLKAQLKRAQRMESIGTIVSGISHNFRNILAGIMANSQLIQMKYQDNSELHKYASGIINLAKTGSDLIGSLLQFSSKGTKRQKGIFNITEVLQETYQIISKSFDKSIEIRKEWPELLPIDGDRSGLGQAFMNLCTNARDAMTNGGLLQIEARKEDDRIAVVISDTGCGMDEETIERIFDPFFTTKDLGKGTGLGLSTAYGIIKDHRGEIHVNSQPGLGTSFKIYFPLLKAVEPSQEKSSYEIILGKGQKILIVDDDETVLQPMEEALRNMGYKTSSADSGQRAIEKYKAWAPDVVLMDRNMPGMDGLTTSKHILALDSKAKIVIVSGYDEDGPDGIDSRIKSLINGYITKPFDIVEVSRILTKVVDK